MNVAIPRWLAPWLVGAGLMAIALALTLTVRAYVQLRRAEFYIVREEARRTVVRASLLVLVLVLLTVVSFFIPRQAPKLNVTLVTVPEPSLTLPPTRGTPLPVATAPATPLATATEPFIPTSTPQATLPVTFTTPLPSAVPPPADARIEFWVLAQEVDDSNRPVGRSEEFSEGVERIYLFFNYDGLLPNVPLTVIWYRNGEYLSGWTDLWESQRSAGQRFVFLSQAGGYTVGEYEVQVWLGNRLQIRTSFSVVGAED